MDFTIKQYSKLLQTLRKQGFLFLRVDNYLSVTTSGNLHGDQLPNLAQSPGNLSNSERKSVNEGFPEAKTIILRHDVDARPGNALRMAQLEHQMGIHGTYYFRIPHTFNQTIILQIAQMGHEIGYHYETNATIGKSETRRIRETETKRVDRAYSLFVENLGKMREIVPVKTICMHGSPLSKFDNRAIWEKHSYRSLDLIGDAYLDIDFNRVAYYTDTGRRWDGSGVSIRDKVQTGGSNRKAENPSHQAGKELENIRSIHPGKIGSFKSEVEEINGEFRGFPQFRSSNSIIRAVQKGTFPQMAMITIHPQRWNDSFLPWCRELVFQNFKNIFKRMIVLSGGINMVFPFISLNYSQ